MKKLASILLFLAAICGVAGVAARSDGAAMTGREEDDRTLSPYFFVQSDDPSLDRLPLKSTSATVDIAGVIADVRVTQVYRNEGKRPLEAIYVFPASTRAAVYGMKMTIGKRTIVAKVREREKARREYEQARQEGKTASLLEQQRPNVFQMNVANILPGDEIRVELSYTELLVPTGSEYQFVYPTVVGPRYVSQSSAGTKPAETWTATPYFHEGKKPSYDFAMRVNLVAGMPLQEIASPSHRVELSYDGTSKAMVRLSPKETAGGNRDFILKYRLAGGKVESGLLLAQGKTENFFLLMLEPPKRVRPQQITPREYIFIVDVSGSMHGFPLEVSKKLLRNLIGALRPTDRFNVLLFAGGSSLMAEQSIPATPANLDRALQVIDRQRGGGGTELLPAMKRALALPRIGGFSRTVVVATDGYVSVEAETFDLIRNNLGDANLFAFGIGSSVNRFIIEGMARAGMGEPFVITGTDEAGAEADRFRAYIQSPVLTRVRVAFDGFRAYDVEPVFVPDVLAERPVIVFGKWRGARRGTITVRGIGGGGTYTKTIPVASATVMENGALRYLWARHRIAMLGDYENLRHSDQRAREITQLGLAYNLLTRYTSFVAIDSRVRREGGDLASVEQPLPLPEGVSDLAVGGTGQALMTKGMAAAPSLAVRAKREAPALEEKEHASNRAGSGRPSVSIDAAHVTWQNVGSGGAPVSGENGWKPYLDDVTAWYKNFLRTHPGVGGTVSLRLTIGPDGRVQKVEIRDGTLQQTALATALAGRAGQWRFPRPAQGQVILTLPLIFQP